MADPGMNHDQHRDAPDHGLPVVAQRTGKDAGIAAAQKPRCACLDRMSTIMPIYAWIVVMFILLGTLSMSWVLPTFLGFKAAADASLTERPAGWVGCRAIATTTASNASDTTTPIMLSRYKAIVSDSLNTDLGESTVDVTRVQSVQDLYIPVCPYVSNKQENFGQALTTRPYVKLVLTLTLITPESATAKVDIRMEVVNALDADSVSALNMTGGSVQITMTPEPPSSANLSLPWAQRVKTVPVTVPLVSVSPITNYPWDVYSITRTLRAEVVVFNNTAFNERRAVPVQVWTQTTTQQFDVFVEGRPGDGMSATDEILQGGNPVIEPGVPLKVMIERSNFTKTYSIVIVVILWLIGGLNLMHMLDNVFVRPRDLSNAFAPALLFGLPSLRSTMPGVPTTVGVAIDMIGLVWAELMIAICVLISFIAFLGQYKHTAPLFRRLKAKGA